jgi:hypothetical protein
MGNLMSTNFTGGCLCGAVSYEGSAEPKLGGHCHCIDCRKSSGTGHSSHVIMDAGAVSMTGDPVRYDKPADSGNMVRRFFCGTCGGPVYSLNSSMPDLVFLRASSLDEPEIFSANLVVYTDRAPSWDAMDPKLPSFPEMPPSNPSQSDWLRTGRDM